MAALAKAFNREKPRSSITEWIEILSSPKYDTEAYDGIPELVDSINLQAEGTAEASRALRKKLKHGDSHHQLRALVILKALVENCGPKFQTSFANHRLTDAIKHMSTDPSTDPNVKKKLLYVLASWKRQFEGDPKMALVASLYDQCRPITRRSADLGPSAEEIERRREKEREKEAQKREKEEAKLRAKKEKQEEQARNAGRQKCKAFNLEQERPKVLGCIVEASQASNNLVNAIMLVNRERESIQANLRVQEYLAKAKAARKQIIRYIQLVEDEELIGTLLETNERVINALEMYDKYLVPDTADTGVEVPLSRTTLSDGNISVSELTKLQEKQRAAVARSVQRSGSSRVAPTSNIHPDLHDLDFGALGKDAAGLPPPIRPSGRDSPPKEQGRGSLSDFSDYDSSNEDTHNQRRSGSPSPIAGKGKVYGRYRSFSDENVNSKESLGRQALLDDADPFADPDVSTPGITYKKGMEW